MKKKCPLFIVGLLILSLALSACAGNGGNTGSSGSSDSSGSGGASTDAASDSGTATVDAANAPTLLWLMGNPGEKKNDSSKVEEVLNEISVAKIGAKMKTLFYDDENVKLALTSGEKWDITFTCDWWNNYAVQAQAGYFADLSDKVKEVTPSLYATMPDVVWEGSRVNGKIFAVPTKKDYAAEMFYRFDKALFVDELGMSVPETMDFFAVEPYLKAAKEAFQNGVEAAAQAEYPFKLTKAGYNGIDSNFDMINRDVMLGIPYSAVGTSDENTVVLTLESPDLVDRFTAIRRWYELGYINGDAPNIDDAGIYSAVKNGQGFYGADAIWSGGDGYTQLISKFSGPFLSTASIRGSMNAINVRADDIDLALRYLELVNTDQEYRDILRYGIEGEHWNRTPEGLVQRTAAGQNGYSVWAFSQGSYSLASVEWAEGVDVDPNMWDVVFEGYKDALATNTIGFSFDISPVEAKVAACTAVKNKYFNGLCCGSLDVESTLAAFISELEAAGIRDIQAECQRQLDAFIAAK